MIVRTLAALLVLAVSGPAFAEDAPSFDDPGMHFSAPAGWTRLDLPAGGGQSGGSGGQGSEDAPPAAAFAYHRGLADQRSIVIAIKPYRGSLDDLDRHRESELRHADDTIYFEKRNKTALSNGMPAYFLQMTSGSDVGHFMRRYEYVIEDGQRSIEVTYAGRQGDFPDSDALTALSTLYVVAYPGTPHA